MVTPATGSLSLAVLSRVPCTWRSPSAAYDGPAAIVTTAKTAIRPANARAAQAVQAAVVRLRTACSRLPDTGGTLQQHDSPEDGWTGTAPRGAELWGA